VPPDPPCREHDQQRGAPAKHARAGS
jgi:hypothetical protein